jgi:hypothetical protein
MAATLNKHDQTEPAPVLLLGFNRADLFSEVLMAVRAAAPRELFVSLDGPRAGNTADAERCAEVRGVAEAIDWAPAVHINARDGNLGCGRAVSSGISWALARVERLIVLEDDCLPDPSFFPFCDELLERFAADERVMQIAGCNWGAAAERYGGFSYAFNSFAPVWGWATWRRAWEMYEYRLESWPRFKQSGLLDGIALGRRFRSMMRYEWDVVHAGGGTWDHQWQYAVMRNNGLSVSPSHNLCVNLGLRADATNLNEADFVFSKLPLESMEFPLRHPPEVARNPAVDALFEKVYWHKMGRPFRIYRRLVRNERVRRSVRKVSQRARTRPR